MNQLIQSERQQEGTDQNGYALRFYPENITIPLL